MENRLIAPYGTLDLPIDLLPGLSEHSRQESGDSGLGMGVSQTYSMPTTPEDFLSNIDDNMDCTSENGGATLDANDISISENIDSTDDIMPSLQVSVQSIAFIIHVCICYYIIYWPFSFLFFSLVKSSVRTF